MKTFFRILTAPVWIPLALVAGAFIAITASILWLMGDDTWSECWGDVTR